MLTKIFKLSLLLRYWHLLANCLTTLRMNFLRICPLSALAYLQQWLESFRKSNCVKSGELAGHGGGPCVPIHFFTIIFTRQRIGHKFSSLNELFLCTILLV